MVMNLDFLAPIKLIALQITVLTQLNIIRTFISEEPFTVKTSATILKKSKLITKDLKDLILIQDLG